MVDLNPRRVAGEIDGRIGGMAESLAQVSFFWVSGNKRPLQVADFLPATRMDCRNTFQPNNTNAIDYIDKKPKKRQFRLTGQKPVPELKRLDVSAAVPKPLLCWKDVTGFPGFALYLTAVSGSADPSIGAVA